MSRSSSSSDYAEFFRRRFPSLWRSLRMVKYPLQTLGKVEAVFTRIYEANRWESGESRSGPGSTLQETAALRRELPLVLKELGVRTLLDAPCGDYNWMSRIDLHLHSYVGGEVVKDLVDRNNREFANERVRFVHLDLLHDDIPHADAILCRDCLVHLSDKDVRKALANFKRSGATYLLTTTYPGRGPSLNIIMGEWQPLDLEAAPFFLPAPERLISEEHLERDGTDSRKSLGVWRLAELSVD